MIHFLGEGGYKKFSKNLNKPMASIMPKEASYNKAIFYDKGGRMRTGNEIKQFMLNKLKKSYKEYGIDLPFSLMNMTIDTSTGATSGGGGIGTPNSGTGGGSSSNNSGENGSTPSGPKPSKGIKDDPVYNKLKARYGTGYKEDEFVVSPVTGKLEKGKDGEIIIKALDEDDLPNVPEGYKRFYETEYKGIIAGYKIKIEGVEEATSDKKGKYKEQISKNALNKIANKEEREKVEKIEKEKKDAPEKQGDYVKEGTIIGKVKDASQIGAITITMYNNDESIVDRPADYFVRNMKSSGFNIKIDENYDTRTSTYDGELPEEIFNELDPDDPESANIFKSMFAGWVQGKETIMEQDPQAFLNMQKEYGVNAIFAAAVTMIENTRRYKFKNRWKQLF